MRTLDARGISCPEPLLMLKKALKTEIELIMLVDSKNTFDNCSYYAERQGCALESEKEGDVYRLHIKAPKS